MSPALVLLLSAVPAGTLGIFDVGLAGIEPRLHQSAIDALATAAASVGYKVVSKSELDAMLGAERLKDSLGCDDVSCLTEIGMAAGVERIIGGSISKVDQALVVSLQLISVHYANVENRVTLSWPGSADELPRLLATAAEMLLLPGRQRQPGSLSVTGIDASAAVYVDGEPRGVGPQQLELELGVHALRCEAPGYEVFSAPFLIRSGQTTLVEVSLVDKPFYSRWWFWTGAGAIVVGGVVGGLLVLRDEPQTGVAITSMPPE